jgi:hypothetical protein
LNKQRRAKPCPEPQDAEALARAVNAEAWEPLPGMVKKRCSRCHYWFAAAVDSHEPRCPDCRRSGEQKGSLIREP